MGGPHTRDRGPRRASTPAAGVLDWGSLWPGSGDFKKIRQVLGNKSVGGASRP